MGSTGGYAEILVLQRDIARIWGYPHPEDEKDHGAACRYPWRFLAETEAGLHRACATRSGAPVRTPYRPEAPMCILDGAGRRRSRCGAGRSLIIPPEGPPGSPFVGAAPLFQPLVPMPAGPPSGPLAIMPGQWPPLYDIEECEGAVEGGRRRRRSSFVAVGDAAGDYWRGGAARRSRSGVGSGRGEGRGGAGVGPGESRERAGDAERGRNDGVGHAEHGGSSRRGPSRIVVERSECSVAAETGNLDGGGSDEEVGGSLRVRSVRVRLSISRERNSSGDEAGKEEKGDDGKGDEKGV